MMTTKKSKGSRRAKKEALTPEVIDACLRNAAATVREVEESTASSFRLPPDAATLRLGSRR